MALALNTSGARFSHLALATALITGIAVSAPVLAQRDTSQEGVKVGSDSRLKKLVPAEQLEQAAAQQYAQLLSEARSKNALIPSGHPQLVRLRTIATRILPFTPKWNSRANDWPWEVNLINSKQLNAFCMPGGKIAFYTGILEQLQLTDDEVAMIMGHEIAHALREHARERVAKTTATRGVISIGSQLLGLGDLGRVAAGVGGQLLTLKFGRDDETEADLVGMDLAARAGFDPRAGVSLWQKMGAANKGAPPQWLSTHPSGNNRIAEIEKHLPEVLPLYARAKGTTLDKLPAYKTSNVAPATSR